MSQPNFNQPQYGGAPGGVVRDHPDGTAVLVTGIVSIFCCGPVGIYSIIKGNAAMREIDQNPMAYSNRTMVQIGRILGYIGVVLMVLSIIWVIFSFVIAAGASA